MPTTRRRQGRAIANLVTPAAVDAWKIGDWSTVSTELRLKPWECSPSWCSRFRTGGKPCKPEEPHRGCERGQELRAELEERAHADQ